MKHVLGALLWFNACGFAVNLMVDNAAGWLALHIITIVLCLLAGWHILVKD